MNTQENQMSALMLANVEALAQNENNGGYKSCDTKYETTDSAYLSCGYQRPAKRVVTSKCTDGNLSYCYSGKTVFSYTCANSDATTDYSDVKEVKCN